MVKMSKFVIVLFCSIYIVIVGFCGARKTAEMSRVLKEYKESGYNREIRPNYGGNPLIVNISMHIKHISSVSEVDMADFLLRQTWNDERLAFNETTGLQQLIVGANYIKKIWIPDSFIVNSKRTSFHTSANLETNSFLRIKPNGDVYYSLRVTVVSVCQMDLTYFPMDTQICELQIGSYGYTADELVYYWRQSMSTEFHMEMTLPNFKIRCHTNDRYNEVVATGNYSRLRHRIVFSRSIGYYLNQVYIPAIMIVVISWIPFWLDRDDNHARVGLGVTTVLTMTTLVTNTNAAMPKISYMKSLDIYLEVCFAMVFASLMQYASVGYITAQNCRRFLDLNKVETMFILIRRRELHFIGNPSRIDFYSRWVFPIVFILFNTCYWILNIKLSKSDFCINNETKI